MRGDWNHVEPNITQERPEDNTSEYIREQIAVWRNTGTVVHPETAMEIAAWYHGPGFPGITAFSHSGTITNDLIPELERDRDSPAYSATDRDEISAVLAYVRTVQGIDPDEEELIKVTWHPKDRTWTVGARASSQSEWSIFDDAEDQLDELLGIARDVATGG